MKILNQFLLILEMLFILTPISFYLVLGLGFVLSGVLEQPTSENLLIGSISILAALSTIAVWYVTGAAIKRLHHFLRISNFWWGLVLVGFGVCLGVIAIGNITGIEYRLGEGFLDTLPVFLMGSPLAIPAIHSMFVFRYANGANK
ncbi:hypothetical protein [Vibrio sp.]|uniref:hypothetical protein n=1 Tax=Vibrio sp. TaxID=678 RepID=UPI003D0B2A44